MTGVRSQHAAPRFGQKLTGASWTRWATVAMLLPVLATLIWAVQGGTQDAKLDTTDTQLVLKGQYLFQFAKGNDWPSSVKSGPFVVAVHGKPALVENLAQKYAAAAIGSQSLRIESVENEGDMGNAHVLYTEATGPELDRILSAVKGQPTLVVTAMQQGLLPGVGVNLYPSDNQLRYEINFQEAEKRGILVGNRIASWAVNR